MYILTLTCNDGEKVILNFETFSEAIAMRQAFMLTGDYKNASVNKQGDNHA